MKTCIVQIGKSITLAVLAFVATSSTASSAVLLEDDFNEGTPGNALASPWTTASTGGTGSATYNDITSISGNSAQVSYTEAGGGTQFFLTRNLTSTFDINSYQTLEWNFSFNMASLDRQVTFKLQNSTDSARPVVINVGSDSGVRATTSSGSSLIGTVSAGSWYDVSVTLHGSPIDSEITYDVSLWNHQTSVLVGSLTGLSVSAIADISTFQMFVVSSGGVNQTVFLDNIRVESVPEPSAVLLLGLASSMVFLKRRRSSQMA